MEMRITLGNATEFKLVGVHASIDLRSRRGLWQQLSHLLCGNLPCVIVGDLNAILSNEEKLGGLDKEDWELEDFWEFVSSNGLIDLGFKGYPFTWNNRRQGPANVRERLDRALANTAWLERFPFGRLDHLHRPGSDHSPILLNCCVSWPKCNPRFIFDKRWSAHEDCGHIVVRCWGMHIRGSKWYQILKRLKKCRQNLISWRARNASLNFKIKVNTIKDKLQKDLVVESFNVDLFRDLELQLADAYREAEGF
ncbi:hypothetical protein Dimus_039487 [Dionaea muscipula]